MSAEGHHLLIVNPASGSGRGGELLPEVERQMRAHRLQFGTVVTRSLEHGVEAARDAVARGEIPIVVSGDGLVGQVGGALAETGATLGVVPGGRGNDFARAAGIPTDPAEAVALIAAGATREIDVGEVNGRRFLCIASIGFDAVANEIANETKLIRGNLVYAYAALKALAGWKPARFAVRLDDEREVVCEGFSVAVANSNAYGGGMFIAPDAKLDDGLFDVVLAGKTSKLRFLTGLPKVFKGTHVEEQQVQVLRAARVEVSADREFAVYADGERLSEIPAKLRVLPRALRVIAPPGGPAA